MKIAIKYESSWRNSFLDGDNNQPIPKKGRKYIASITELGKNKSKETGMSANFIKRDITQDTVMGILNRLIGEQRKLYQARQDTNYYFKDIEVCVKFQDNPLTVQEMVYLRNVSGSTDQNSFTGSIKSNDQMFCSDYSKEFWGILALDLDELCDFVLNDTSLVSKTIGLDPISIITQLEILNKLKPIENSEKMQNLLDVYFENFGEVNYLNSKEQLIVVSLYTSALYLQLKRLSSKYDMSSAKTKSGGISGISKRGFTKKDFMDKFTTGSKKKIFGNPYIHETFVKGQGKNKEFLTKANGTLDITIDITREKAKELKTMIENAGVSSFYLGKKGLAYVEEIDTREVRK